MTEGHVSIERGRERERENEPMLSTPLIFFTLATTNFSLSVSKRNKKNEKNVARSNQLGPERGERECVNVRVRARGTFLCLCLHIFTFLFLN